MQDTITYFSIILKVIWLSWPDEDAALASFHHQYRGERLMEDHSPELVPVHVLRRRAGHDHLLLRHPQGHPAQLAR